MLAHNNIPPQYLLSSVTSAPSLSTATNPWQADMMLVASAGNVYQVNSTGGSSVWGGAGGGVSTATWFAGSNTVGASSGTFNLSSIVFAGAGAISVKVTDGSVVVSGNAAAGDGVNIVMVGSNTSGGAATTSAGTNTTGTVSLIAGSNISLVQTNNSIVIYGGAGGGGVAIQAGTQTATSGTVVFSNSNNISIGMSNSSVITARGWINASDSAGPGPNFSQVMLSETNGVTLRFSSTGGSVITLYGSVAAQTAQTQSNVQGIIVSNTTYRTGDVSFSNLNGISFGSNGANVVTASYTVPSTVGFLTTAALSQDSSKYAGTGFTSTTTSGTAIVGTHNTAGLSIGVPAFLTTAMASNAATISNVNLSAGTTSNNLSAFVMSNSNGISFGLNGSTITGSHNALTTAALSQDSSKYAFTGFTTTTAAGATVVGTQNTAGLLLGVPSYLTTADLSQNSSKYAGTATSLNLTNLTGTLSANTAGVSLSLSAYPNPVISRYENMAPMGGTVGMAAISSSGGSQSGGGYFMLPIDGSFGFARFPVQMTTSSRAMVTSGDNAGLSEQAGMYSTWNLAMYSFGTGASSKSLISYTTTSAGATQQFSNSWAAAESNYSHSWAATYGYESNSTSFSNSVALSSASIRYFVDLSSGWTGFTGYKFLDISFNVSLSRGNYFHMLGLTTSSSSGGNGGGYATRGTDCGVRYASQIGFSGVNSGFADMGNSSLSVGMQLGGQGAFSTAGGGTTSGIPFNNITTNQSQLRAYFQLLRLA